MVLFELLEDVVFIEGLEVTTEGVTSTVGFDKLIEEALVEGVGVEDAEAETCDVVVAFTEFDTVLLAVALMEAEVETAVPKQATPPSL